MGFADSQFEKVLALSPFSQTGRIDLGNGTRLAVMGFFCSGSYGSKEYDKGYSTAKTKKGQSFKVALSSIPDGVELLRKKILIDEKWWVIDDVTGNQSGILCLVLKPAKDPTTVSDDNTES